MVVEWREREHDAIDAMALEDEACMEALRDCGLKKFFLTSYLRAQPELLRFIVDAWDIEDQVFRLRDQTLELDVSDIYFITGLSQRGACPILTGSRPSGEKMGEVMDRTAGVQAPHEASKNHLLLATECLNPTLFDWATSATVNIKRQLTKCKRGGRDSGGSIATGAQDGSMVALMPRGGGGQQMAWRPEFFIWLRHQMIAVEDWPYVGTDFTGDPDLALPAGED
ncbi:Hypothetical predicted protein [Olea europaea subsp. europaea]|uniref:Uncharacterized protein n=1 Tax=Olea europaea subsp. europaea TaxID=158383 RepID=A0A8S0UGF3_OLEEU|nr:Hypothetical predicted protein [Olea europaea subsp. europaea]